MAGGRLAFLGVPIDSVERTGGGAEHSPGVLRELGLSEVLGGSDLGDLDVRIRGDERDAQTGVLGSADVLATTAAVRSAVADAVRRGRRPFLAGGCCALVPGAVAGARDALGRVGLAYVDGHLDLYDGLTSATGEAADMPVAVVIGRGPAAWVDAAGGPGAAPADVVVVGHRHREETVELGALQPQDAGISEHTADAVRSAGPHRLGAEIATALAAGPGRLWLHLDVDVLDEEVFPATDYPQPGGLTWEQLVELMKPMASSPGLVGASIGCYNPDKDPDRRHGRALVEAWRAVLAASA